MADFGDRMLDLMMDRGSGDTPTGDLLLAALEALSDEEPEVLRFFRCWVWAEWCEANLPAPGPVADHETVPRRFDPQR